MKEVVYTIGNSTIGFSIDSIRKRYAKKSDFVTEIVKAHPHIDKKALADVLERVWNIAFPQKENNEKGAE